MAQCVDNDCVAEFRKAQLVVPEAEAFDKYMIVDMIEKFGEEIEEEMTLIVHPEQLADLRRDKDFVAIENGQKVISGEMGQIFGCRVVVSNKAKNEETGKNEMFLVKNGAVEILMKRNVAVEADRDIVHKVNTFVVDEHYVVYLRDASKVVKATVPSKPQA